MADSLDTKKILRYYLPLMASWLFMALEGPFTISLIQRLSHPAVNAAAMNVAFGLAIWIESPVIDLLSTATTLATNRPRFDRVRKFALFLMGWVAFAHTAVVATPLYGVVTGSIMGIPGEVAASARPALLIMIPWAAIIGWRRTHQGLLIRFDNTRAISQGTTLRVLTMAIFCIGAYAFFSQVPSVVLAAIALMGAVSVEAVFIHFVSRRTVLALRSSSEGHPRLGWKELALFHGPLAGTTMVNLLVGPFVASGLSRTHSPIQALASYQVATALFLIFRMMTFSLPEIVVALSDDLASVQKLRKFSLSVGLICSGTMLVMAIVGIDRVIFSYFFASTPEISKMAHEIFLGCCLLPLVDSLLSFVRGRLAFLRRTASRLTAIAVAIAVLLLSIALLVTTQARPAVIVGASITASLVSELIVLSWSLSRSEKTA